MPKEIPQAVLENNEQIILDTLDSFSRTPGIDKNYRAVAATRAESQQIILTKVKPRLKQVIQGREDEQIRQLYGGINPFLSEAAGSYGIYQYAYLITALHFIDISGTPFENVKMATFLVGDKAYMPGYFRTEVTKGLPLEQARPKSDFGKLLKKLLIEASEHGHVDFDSAAGKEGTFYLKKIDHEKLTSTFWGT